MYNYIGKPILRPDAKDKVTGRTKFPSDYLFDNMLWVKVLRSAYPLARIKNIDTTMAEQSEGVVRVFTSKDIPGLNGFGIAIQDQPVFCNEYVRYQGDAVACVAAESLENAISAVNKIKVDYEVLEPIVTYEQALAEDGFKLHEKGNILQNSHFSKGEALSYEIGSEELVVEKKYHTSMMDHLFLETEAGVAFYDEDGKLTIIAGGQYPQRDQTQIARVLNLKNEDIRVISGPIGGGFGGKDEITIQMFIALTTYFTKRPSRIFLDRDESLIAGMKRHSMDIELKTANSRDGRFTFLSSSILSDTGAYASLGGPILNLCMEHMCGVYKIPNVDVVGKALYTNNGFSAAYRGFGATQATVAIESQVDIISRHLNIDPLEFRLMNALERGDIAGLGNKMVLSVGVKKVLESMKTHPLYLNRKELKKDLSDLPEHKRKFVKRGIGIAICMQGCGLGVGLPDYAGATLRLHSNGNIELFTGGCEMGQGACISLVQILAESINCPVEQIKIHLGDTSSGPDSGSSTASRTTYAIGNAIIDAAKKLKKKMKEILKAAQPDPEISIRQNFLKLDGEEFKLETLIKEPFIEVKGNFIVPVSDVELGDGLPHILYCYAGHIAKVDVDIRTGEISVPEVVAFLDPGAVINKQGIEGQSDGGVVMALGYSLFEDTILEKGFFKNPRLSTYIIPTSMDAPQKIETIAVEVPEETGPYLAKGIGEIVTVSVTPAILNGIYDAIGIRFYKLPVLPEDVIRNLKMS